MAWQDGGRTDVENLALLCDFHHDHHQRQGWNLVMIDGHPCAIPPTWVDPLRRPIRNTMHNPTVPARVRDPDTPSRPTVPARVPDADTPSRPAPSPVAAVVRRLELAAVP